MWSAVLFTLLLVHTLVITLGFVLHYYDAANNRAQGDGNGVGDGPDEPSLSLGGYARAWAREWWYGLAAVLSLPFGLLPQLRESTYRPGGGPPILLVHGYFSNRAAFYAIYWRLRRHGFENVYAVNLSPIFGAAETAADHLIGRIRSITRQSGSVPMLAVGHGFGGLVLRYCVQQEPSLPIARIVCLGSPHRGTRMAVFAPATSGAQLRPGSSLVRALETTSSEVPITSLYSAYDNFVLPARSAALGDVQKRFDHCGHYALLYDGAVFDALLAEVGSLEIPAK